MGRRAWPPLALVALVVAAYANGLRSPLVFDDVWLAPLYAGGNPLRFLDVGAGMRPLYALTFWLNHALGGWAAWGYHAVNIALHAGAVLCLHALVKLVLELPGDPRLQRDAAPIAFLAAALWAVHPLQTETVTYVSQRCEAMTGLFLFGALLLLARGRLSLRRGWLWQAAAAAAFVCGLASKETMVFFLPLVALFDRTFLAASWFEACRRGKVFYLTVAAALAVPAAALLAHGNLLSMLSSLWTRGDIHASAYMATQPKAIAHYLRLALWPDSLCFDYGWPLATTFAEQFWPGALLLALLVLGGWTAARQPRLGFLGLWLLLTLAPRALAPGLDIVVEHRMYLPLAGLCVLAAAGLGTAAWGRLALGLAVCALALATIARNEVYASPAALWADTVAKSPGNPRALNYLGIEAARAGDLPRARELFERSLGVMPGNAEVLNNLAGMLAQAGDDNAALELYHQALEAGRKKGKRKAAFDQREIETLLNMARVNRRKGDVPAAVACYGRATQGSASVAGLHEFGAYLLELGDGANAAPPLRRAAALSPDNALLVNDIGVAELLVGDTVAAERDFLKAAALDPSIPQPRRNLSLLKRPFAAPSGADRP